MKRIVQFITIILSSIALMIVVSYAWYTNAEFVEPNLSGYSTDAYFGGGDGSPEMPFIIKNPRHLYNLAWLQYLDYFNKPVSEDPDAPHAPDGTITQYSFVIIRDLDMSGYVLPPIGTTIRPFIGNINGRGYTISNLTTSNKFSDFGDKYPSTVTPTNFANCESIGLFGCIGQTSTMEAEDSSLTLNESYNGITNIYLDSCTVDTYGQTLVGAVSGYVNGSVTNIAVRQPNIKVNSNAAYEALHSMGGKVSNYTLVGYAEDEYTTLKSKRATTIYNPTTTYSHFNYNGMGNANEWGGSMNMTDLYNRILGNIPANGTTISSYIKSEIQYNYTHSAVNTTSSSSSHVNKNYSNASGSYIKTTASDYFNYLTALYKDVIKVTKLEETENGYKISQSGNYLNINSSRANNNSLNFTVSVGDGTNQSEATVWVYNNNKLYTYNEDDGYKYYLVANNDFSLSVTNVIENATTWNSVEESNNIIGFSTTKNSTTYYLKFFTNQWTISQTYVISDGNGNYLKYDNGFSNVTSANEATIWLFSNDGQYPSGTIRNASGQYLLNNNGSLQVDTTNSNNVWTNDNGQIYNTLSNIKYYIQYDTTWKLSTITQVYIHNGNNYLNTSLGNNNTSSPGSTHIWTYTNNNNLSNGTQYLNFNNNVTNKIELGNNANTQWYIDDNGYYCNYNNSKYYLVYDTNWKASTITLEGYYISDGSGNYLTANGTNSVTNSFTPTTVWVFSNMNQKSGTVSTIINGNSYYLYQAESNSPGLSLSTTSKSYINDENKLYFTYSSGGLFSTTYHVYVRYNNGWTGGRSRSSHDDATTLSFTEKYDTSKNATVTLANINSLSFIAKSSNLVTSVNSINRLTRETGIVEPSVFNYIPLNALTSSPYTVDDKNTGYIMSGAYSESNYTGRDIRVSQYLMRCINPGSSYATENINSTGSGTSTKFVSFKEDRIYTVDGLNNNSIHTIDDDNNSYVKYTQSKELLSKKLVESETYLYGLHFMDADINKNHLVVAPEVKINGKTYANYQMPENCIDFQLASKGYINFFAGSYFAGNNSFFSLHQIIRDETDANNDGILDNPVILDIKHISRIYKANSNYGLEYKSADYVYEYDDGTYSITNFNSNNYDLVFKKEWIESPGDADDLGYGSTSTGTNSSSRNNCYGNVFYFEIPVNKGEFALGSVSGRTGAYLFYLDIGANAAPVDRTEITQQTTTVVEDYRYVNGIQLIQTIPASQADPSTHQNTITVDASNTLVTYINTSVTQNITLTRTGDNAISSSVALNSSYIADTVTSHPNITLTPLGSNTSTIKVLKYRDFNKATDRMYETTVICDGSDGTNNTSYSTYRLVFDANGNITDKILMANQNTSVTDAVKAEYGLLYIDTVNDVLVGKGVITDDNQNDGNEYKDYVTISPSTSSEILSYSMTVLTENKNTINEVISFFDDQVMEDSKPTNVGTDIIRITSNTTINGYTITGGSYEFTNEDPTYTMDYMYRLATESATITSGESNMIIKITAVAANDGNANNTYTFTINGTTVTAVNQQITVNAT